MLSGISIWQLLILLVIVVLVFGTKRLRNLGGDVGSALKDFRGAMKDEDKQDDNKADDKSEDESDPQVVSHVNRDNPSSTDADKSESERRD